MTERPQRTPGMQRLPVLAVVVIAVAVPLWVTHSWWLELVLTATIAVLGSMILRYVFDVPWSRILRYRERD